jgi:hypothetical protein
MNLRFPIITLALLLMSSCSVDNKLFITKQGDKYGYIRKNGKVAIDAKYKYAHNFNHGFAWVHDDGVWKLIDKKQRIIISAYSTLQAYNHGFSEGLCAVKDSATMKVGYINNKGEWTLAPKYDEGRDFHQGLAAVYIDKKWFYINKRAKPILTKFENYRYIYDFKNGLAAVETRSLKKGYINKKGELVIDTIYDINSGELSENRINVRYDFGYDFINKKGKHITNSKFKLAREFFDNRAIISVWKDNYYEKFGIINRQGKIIVEPQYKSIEYPGYSDGLVVFEGSDEQYGYMNKWGKIVIEPKFESASEFRNGLADVTLSNDKQAYINRKGKIVWEEE